MGGGIGITPMLAMAHRLHAIGADFELHYSCKRRDSAGFLQDLATAPWAHRVHLHVSAEGYRADLDSHSCRLQARASLLHLRTRSLHELGP